MARFLGRRTTMPQHPRSLLLARGSSLNGAKTVLRSNPSTHGPGPTTTPRRVIKGLSTTPTRVKKEKASQPPGRASAPAFTSSGIIRTRRSAPVHEFHAGTFIPPSFGLTAPRPPHRDQSQDVPKFTFTDGDKVFFIHFLHWRLGQPGAIPFKQDLYDALGDRVGLPLLTALYIG